MNDVLTRDQAFELCQRILGRTQADGAQVNVESTLDGHTRFARNGVSTAGDARDAQATLTVRFGQRSAAVSFNAFDEAALGAAVDRAEGLARVAPDDPELMPLLDPQEYATVPAFFPSTAGLGAEQRAAAVLGIVEPAAAAGLVATGFLERRVAAVAVANSAGLFAYHRRTLASLTSTVRTPAGDGSGWAGTTHNDWGAVTPALEIAARAIGKARASAAAAAPAPGAYTVVLEPTAVGNLLQGLRFGLDARSADEGRSFFSKPGGGNRIGERVVDGRVTIVSDPQDEDLLEEPFTGEGLPVPRTTWIEGGVLRHLAYSRYWAAQQGVAPVPVGGGLKLQGADAGTVEDLVATVERGLLVTRFWYIRSVDPRTLTFTGLTRDGTFRIDNGRIAGAVKNLRFNESVPAMLRNVVALGRAVRVVAAESGGLGGAVVVPPLVARNFHFTSVSDAV